MIKMYKNYRRCVNMIDDTSTELFEKLKDISPGREILPLCEFRSEILYISDLLSRQITEIFELTVGESIDVKFSFISVFKYKINKKLFCKLMIIRTKRISETIDSLVDNFDDDDISAYMAEIFLLAQSTSERDTLKYLNYNLNRLDKKVRR